MISNHCAQAPTPIPAARIRIERFLVRDLERVAERLKGRASNQLTIITPHRAAAYSRNPCADDNDIGLLVAFRGQEPVGYLGLMPGRFWTGSMFVKVHWLTTWHVPVLHRQTGAGSMLMMAAMGLRYHLLASAPEMGENARHVYRQLGFQELRKLPYSVIGLDRRNPVHGLVRRVRQTLLRSGLRLRGLGRVEQAAARFCAPFRRRAWQRLRHLAVGEEGLSIRSEEVGRFQEGALESPIGQQPHFSREVEVINWMIRDPWVRESSPSNDSTRDYYFSSVREKFRYVPIVFRSSTEADKVSGFCILSVFTEQSMTTIKLLDHCYRNDSIQTKMFEVVLHYAAKFSANQLVLPHGWWEHFCADHALLKIMMTGTIHYFARAAPMDSGIGALFNRAQLFLWDGDMAFY